MSLDPEMPTGQQQVSKEAADRPAVRWKLSNFDKIDAQRRAQFAAIISRGS